MTSAGLIGGSVSDVTRLLNSIQSGDTLATEQLLPLVYGELKQIAAAKMAREQPGQTLQTTALVHEAYLRLVDENNVPRWETRGHFFAAAAEAMRRILVERARRRARLKRGGDWQRVDLDSIDALAEPKVDIEALDESLRELESLQPDKAELVKLRFFAGLSVSEAAQVLGISTATAGRNWRYARAWLADKLTAEDSSCT